MKYKEEKQAVKHKLDWIPLVGEWLSEKLGLVEYLWTYTCDLGENGEVIMVTLDSLGENRAEILGQVARRVIMNSIQSATIEIKGHKIYVKAEIKRWTT